MPRARKPASPFRYFNSSPEVIRLVVMMYVRFPLSLRNVEDLLIERGIDLCHETVRHWRNRCCQTNQTMIESWCERGDGHWSDEVLYAVLEREWRLSDVGAPVPAT